MRLIIELTEQHADEVCDTVGLPQGIEDLCAKVGADATGRSHDLAEPSPIFDGPSEVVISGHARQIATYWVEPGDDTAAGNDRASTPGEEQLADGPSAAAVERTRCQYCGGRIAFVGGYWRDDSADPGDGYGGDATCGPLVTATGAAAQHVPV